MRRKQQPIEPLCVHDTMEFETFLSFSDAGNVKIKTGGGYLARYYDLQAVEQIHEWFGRAREVMKARAVPEDVAP